ncbi:hypothetical protein C8R43DRAFT_1115921 [Mycena crocata]|nr:hypothetical protein C8R43DRAFT_1115921 [Mycena crocata]
MSNLCSIAKTSGEPETLARELLPSLNKKAFDNSPCKYPPSPPIPHQYGAREVVSSLCSWSRLPALRIVDTFKERKPALKKLVDSLTSARTAYESLSALGEYEGPGLPRKQREKFQYKLDTAQQCLAAIDLAFVSTPRQADVFDDSDNNSTRGKKVTPANVKGKGKTKVVPRNQRASGRSTSPLEVHDSSPDIATPRRSQRVRQTVAKIPKPRWSLPESGNANALNEGDRFPPCINLGECIMPAQAREEGREGDMFRAIVFHTADEEPYLYCVWAPTMNCVEPSNYTFLQCTGSACEVYSALSDTYKPATENLNMKGRGRFLIFRGAVLQESDCTGLKEWKSYVQQIARSEKEVATGSSSKLLSSSQSIVPASSPWTASSSSMGPRHCKMPESAQPAPGPRKRVTTCYRMSTGGKPPISNEQRKRNAQLAEEKRKAVERERRIQRAALRKQEKEDAQSTRSTTNSTTYMSSNSALAQHLFVFAEPQQAAVHAAGVAMGLTLQRPDNEAPPTLQPSDDRPSMPRWTREQHNFLRSFCVALPVGEPGSRANRKAHLIEEIIPQLFENFPEIAQFKMQSVKEKLSRWISNQMYHQARGLRQQ